MDDREFAEYVNRIASVARTYAHHQSLRERIAAELRFIVADLLKDTVISHVDLDSDLLEGKTMNEQQIAIWASQDWCFYEEIENMKHMSDDYLVFNVPEDWTVEDIDNYVLNKVV